MKMRQQIVPIMICLLASMIALSAANSSKSYYYKGKYPRADSNPNDIYKDVVRHEPTLAPDTKILYKNLGPLRYFIQDPEKADYLIVPREVRHPNEVSNKEVAAAGPIGIPAPVLERHLAEYTGQRQQPQQQSRRPKQQQQQQFRRNRPRNF